MTDFYKKNNHLRYFRELKDLIYIFKTLSIHINKKFTKN